MALFQIMYIDNSMIIGCEIFQSEKKAAEYATKNYRSKKWFIEQIQ